MIIGQRIFEARKLRKRSQLWLAEHVGIKQPSVSAWESGDADPSIDSLACVAKVLGVCFEWLATGRGPREFEEYQPSGQVPNQDEDLSELLKLYEGLPKARREAVLDFLRTFTKR